LIKNVMLLAAPTLAIFAVTFPGTLRALCPRNRVSRTCVPKRSLATRETRDLDPNQQPLIARSWLGRFFLVVILLHLAYTFAVQARCLHERWLEPFTLFLPMYFLSSVSFNTRHATDSKRYVGVLVGVAICLTLAHGAQIWLGGSQRGYNTMDSDFRLLTRQLQREIKPGSPIITENAALAGNLRLCLPASPCLSAQEPLCWRPTPVWVRPCVLLWNGDGSNEIPPRLRQQVATRPARDRNQAVPVHQVEVPPAAVGRQRKTVRYIILE
jgi:hypothetical protein